MGLSDRGGHGRVGLAQQGDLSLEELGPGLAVTLTLSDSDRVFPLRR